MEDRVGGGDAVRRRIERQVTVDRRLESRVDQDAYGTLLTGARGGTSPGCIIPQLAGQSGRLLQCLAHMGMYSITVLISAVQRNQAWVITRGLAGTIQYDGACTTQPSTCTSPRLLLAPPPCSVGIC